MIDRLLRRAYHSALLRHVMVLTSGSVLAQCIPLLLMVVYARLYTPETFAILGLLQTCVPLMIPLATAYLEWAIPSPRRDSQARLLASMAMGMAGTASVAVLAFTLVCGPEILTAINAQPMGMWVQAYGPMVLFASLLSITNYWLVRKAQHGAQSRARIGLAVASAIPSVGLGYLGDQHGLLTGYVFGMGAGALYALLLARKHGLGWQPLNRTRVNATLKRYKNYPLFGSFPTFMVGLAGQIPLILVTRYYSLADAGHYAVARNILFSGVALIGLCIGQVVLKHIADLKTQRLPIWPEVKRITAWLALAAAALSLGIYLVGPAFFTLYLGAEWKDAADITRILAWASFFWLIAPPLSFAVIAQQKIRWVALWQVGYGLAAPVLLLFTTGPFMEFVVAYSRFEMLAYAAYTALCLSVLYRYGRTK